MPKEIPITNDEPQEKAFATIGGEIGALPDGGYQIQLRASVDKPGGGKLLIASAAINVMTLDIAEGVLPKMHKAALDAIISQRVREKAQAERRIELVQEMPRALRNQ